MKNWHSVYQDNHLTLMKIHIGLAVFHILISAGLLLFLFNEVSDSQIQWGNFLIFLMLLAIPVLVNLALAHGARQKSELSRRLSMALFILIFFCFPIGSIFTVCVGFPALQWEDNQFD